MPGASTYLRQSVGEWIAAMKARDAIERRLAVYALGEMGSEAQSAAGNLRAALRDPAPFVRTWAAAALARVDPSSAEPIPALIAAMKDEAAFVRSLAAWHLGRLGSHFPGIAQAVPALRDLRQDEDPSVRIEAVLALRLLEGKGAPPPELQSLTREP